MAKAFEDQAVIQDRHQQPANSTAIFEPRPDGLMIHVPPAGLLGNVDVAVAFFMGWIGLLVPFTVMLLLSAFGGDLNVLHVCLFLIPFWLIGVGCVLGLLNHSRRCAVITVSGGSLNVTDRDLYGTRQHQWQGSEISVQAVSTSSQCEGIVSWTYALEVRPKHGEACRFLTYRAKSELEWIATVVQHALRPFTLKP